MAEYKLHVEQKTSLTGKLTKWQIYDAFPRGETEKQVVQSS